MKILIVDNEPRRYRKLKTELLKINTISENDIVIVSNILDATDNVDKLIFDIVLLIFLFHIVMLMMMISKIVLIF